MINVTQWNGNWISNKQNSGQIRLLVDYTICGWSIWTGLRINRPFYTKMESAVSSYVLPKEHKSQPLSRPLCKLCSKEGSNNVKVLNCLHEFCEACLKKFLVENSVICPHCGKRMRLGDQGINGLPSHVYYDRVKDIQNCDQWIQQRRDAFCWEM